MQEPLGRRLMGVLAKYVRTGLHGCLSIACQNAVYRLSPLLIVCIQKASSRTPDVIFRYTGTATRDHRHPLGHGLQHYDAQAFLYGGHDQSCRAGH